MDEALAIVGLLAGGLAASEIGFHLGRAFSPKDEAFGRHFDVVRAATFALVAFLIGFAFSGAGSRFVDRLDIVVKEANALGTTWLRADLLPEPERSRFKATLKEYTADRLALVRSRDQGEIERLLGKVDDQQRTMWADAIGGVKKDPATMRLVLPPLNDVIDLHTIHLALAYRHLPMPILVILLATAALSLVMVGFGNGRSGRRFFLLDGIYAIVLAVALWMTIDLDHPRQGMIQISARPLADALATMK